MNMKQTTLCYLERDGQYLMLHRTKKQHDASHGKWIGVGGKCEADESPDECMLREVREETGLELTDYHFCGVIHFISDTWEDEDMYLYRAEISGAGCGDNTGPDEAPAYCDEGELRWIPKNKVADLELWAGDRIFLKLLADDEDFFSLKLVYDDQGNLVDSYRV